MEDTDTSGIDDDEEYEDLVDENNFEDDDDDDINDDEIQANTSDSDNYYDTIDTSITHMEDDNGDEDDDENEELIQNISNRDLNSIINQLLIQRGYLVNRLRNDEEEDDDEEQDEEQDNEYEDDIDYDNQEEEEEEEDEEINADNRRFNFLNPIFLNLLGQNVLLRPRDNNNNNNNNNSNNSNNINQVKEDPIKDQTINSQLQIRLRDQKTKLNRFLLNRELSDKGNENIRLSQHYLPMDSADTVISMPARIFCCKITSDGKRLMTASQDKKIRIFNTSNFDEIKSIDAIDINWSIIDTDYSPDQNWLIYSSWSHYIQLCRVNFNENHQYNDTDFSRKTNSSKTNTTVRGGIKQNFEDYHESLFLDPGDVDRFCVFGLKFSPNNKEILCGCSNGEIIIYDLEGRQVVNHIRGHGRDVNSVCYLDHTGNVFVTGSDDSLIRVWDKRSLDNSNRSNGGNKPVGTFTGHYQGLTHVCSKDDGTYVLSNSKDQSAKLWDIRKMSDPTSKPPTGGANWDYRYYSYPSDYMMPNPLRNGSNVNDVSLMSYRGHQVVQTLIRCYFSPIETTAQKYIYSGSFNGMIYIYDVLTGKLVKTLTDISQNNSQRSPLIRDLAWSPNSLNLISGNWDGKVTSWSEFYDHRYKDDGWE
ncbi:hypothetical protein ACTFIU_005964 [Dictyostelium citrinum]